MKIWILLVGILMLGVAAFAQGEPAQRIVLETSRGAIVLELDLEKAPITAASFLENVDEGVYDGSIFHRVIPDFMVQGGGFKPGMEEIETDKNLKNEADNGLDNLRGTVAMARRRDPDSASIQFFINLVDNPALNHTEKTVEGWGYAVFGRVVEGMEVAEAIASVERHRVGLHGDVPVADVVISSAKRVEAPPPASPEAPADPPAEDGQGEA